jgi:hypothetical protein
VDGEAQFEAHSKAEREALNEICLQLHDGECFGICFETQIETRLSMHVSDGVCARTIRFDKRERGRAEGVLRAVASELLKTKEYNSSSRSHARHFFQFGRSRYEWGKGMEGRLTPCRR